MADGIAARVPVDGMIFAHDDHQGAFFLPLLFLPYDGTILLAIDRGWHFHHMARLPSNPTLSFLVSKAPKGGAHRWHKMISDLDKGGRILAPSRSGDRDPQGELFDQIHHHAHT